MNDAIPINNDGVEIEADYMGGAASGLGEEYRCTDWICRGGYGAP